MYLKVKQSVYVLDMYIPRQVQNLPGQQTALYLLQCLYSRCSIFFIFAVPIAPANLPARLCPGVLLLHICGKRTS